MQPSERINLVLGYLDMMLVVEQPDAFNIRARRELIDLRIDMEISENGHKAVAEHAATATDDLPPLVTDRVRERDFKPDKFQKMNRREREAAETAATSRFNGIVGRQFKCPTCGAPPWHFCVKTSMRGAGKGGAPLGTVQKFDHPARTAKARAERDKLADKEMGVA